MMSIWSKIITGEDTCSNEMRISIETLYQAFKERMKREAQVVIEEAQDE